MPPPAAGSHGEVCLHTILYETQYRIVSPGTGEILDDAQGYGYRTAQKAYAAWAYKTRDRSDAKLVKEMLSDFGLEPDFTVREPLKKSGKRFSN